MKLSAYLIANNATGDFGLKTLILGLGNPIHCDDGVGNRVAEILANKINGPEITVVETSVSGLDLLPLMTGYDRVIIIDAIQTQGGEVGKVYRLKVEDLGTPYHAWATHH